MQKHITVLLSTYNGEQYLKEQIESIICQTDVHLNIIVRDDGSIDGTRKILSEYQERGVLKWYGGENLKPAESFWNLMVSAPESEYYAFSDQDDYWMPDKLCIAIKALRDYEDIPAMYCSAYQMTDDKLNPIHTDQRIPIIDIHHAIMENIATGCTIVFNNKLMHILKTYKPNYYFMHDEWMYKVCVAIGGKVIYDEIPHILYRQHGNNVIGGMQEKWHKRFKDRVLKLFVSSYHHRNKIVHEIVKGYAQLISKQNKCVLEKCLSVNDFPHNLYLALDAKFYKGVTIESAVKIFFLFLFKKF